MPPKSIAYATLCVIVPVVWGLIVYWISSLVEQRVLRKKSQTKTIASPPDDTISPNYHI